MLKRSLYSQLILNWEWVVKVSAEENFGKTNNYEVRKFDGKDQVDGESETVLATSFTTFCSFWQAHFPKLKIHFPLYDSCYVCFEYSCSLGIELEDVVWDDMNFADKQKKANNDKEEEVNDTLKEDEEDEEDKEDGEQSVQIQEFSSELDTSEIDSDFCSESDNDEGLNLKQEELISQIHEHCVMSKTQREYVKEKG